MDHEWLGESALARLTGAVVETHCQGRRTYFGTLIDRGVPRRGHRPLLFVEINPDLAQVLRPLPLDADRLGSSGKQLRRKPLALWLHGFYASHAKPYRADGRVPAQAQRQPDQATAGSSKQNLTQALRDLEAVGAIRGFEIRGDLVHVQTVPSKSQQRHLAAS